MFHAGFEMRIYCWNFEFEHFGSLVFVVDSRLSACWKRVVGLFLTWLSSSRISSSEINLSGVCSVYYQPNSSRRGGPLSRPPADCALGSVGNPFDRVWLPTTTGHLQPVFSCVDSRGTHPLRVYVREYGTHTHVVCTWVCVG